MEVCFVFLFFSDNFVLKNDIKNKVSHFSHALPHTFYNPTARAFKQVESFISEIWWLLLLWEPIYEPFSWV